jgi:hypothetical protein
VDSAAREELESARLDLEALDESIRWLRAELRRFGKALSPAPLYDPDADLDTLNSAFKRLAAEEQTLELALAPLRSAT